MNHGLHTDRARGEHRAIIRACLAFTVLMTTSTLAPAANEPDSQPSNAPIDQTLVPVLPDLPWVWLDFVPLELHQAAPFSPDDKGGTYTHIRGVTSNPLTARETALLELSRQAVEASRLAGTLGVSTSSNPQTPASPEEAARLKAEVFAKLATKTPVPGTGGPADHAIPSVAAPSSSGPVALTAAEIDKLAAARAQAGAVVVTPSDVPVQQDPGAPQAPQSDATKDSQPSVEGK